MRTKGGGGETQQLCTSHTDKASLEAALKWGERTCFHQEQTQPNPSTSKDRKLSAPTHYNFSISALRSPYFIYVLKHMKTFISKTPVQLNIHHARKVQSCFCSEQGRHRASGRQRGFHRDIATTGLGATAKAPPHTLLLYNLPCMCSPRISPVLLKTHVNQEIF